MKSVPKVSYEVLAYQVEILYQKEFVKTDANVSDHCDLIAQFIRSCGWTEEEYMERWLQEQEGNPLVEASKKLMAQS